MLTVGASVGLVVLWVVLFRRHRTVGSTLELVGVSCLVVVALTHVCETFGILPALGWGEPDSVGHYIDLVAAAVGVALVFTGILVRRRELGVR